MVILCVSMQVLLGYENETLKIYINPFSNLNEFGDRLNRGTPFPESYQKFKLTGESPLDAISDLQRYLDQSENRKVYARAGNAKPQTRPKRASSIRVKADRK